MTVCKYMTSQRGLGYLSNWHLKITPPHEFNDPFELKAPSNEVFTARYFEQQFEKNAHAVAVEELAKLLVQHSPQPLPHALAVDVAAALVEQPGSATQNALIQNLQSIPGFNPEPLLEMSSRVSAIWPLLMEKSREMCRYAVPAVNAAIQQGLTERLPSMLGVLCLSRELNQPLMWAHYGDCHRGMMIELDESHVSLHRRRSMEDEFGVLRPVSYSQTRTQLNMDVIEQERFFEVFALTKSVHWSYEEELRLVWPLHLADKNLDTPGGSVALISVPPQALVSVTLGCRATPKDEDDVLLALAKNELCGHVLLRRARMHDTDFSLVYEPIRR